MSDLFAGRPPEASFATVTDPEQARLLTDSRSFRFFEPFIGQRNTVTAAAAKAGCTADTMLYRVGTFVRAGLLEIVELERRAGRPIKHYRSTADGYFVPFHATPYAELEETVRDNLLANLEPVVAGLTRVLRESRQEGRLIYRDALTGEVWRVTAETPADDPADPNRFDRPIGESLIATLHLTRDEAETVLRELYDLWRRFDGHSEDEVGRKAYHFGFDMVEIGS